MRDSAPMREKLFTIRMSPEELSRLERVAGKFGISSAAVVRMLIKREADTLEPTNTQPAKPAKKKGKR